MEKKLIALIVALACVFLLFGCTTATPAPLDKNTNSNMIASTTQNGNTPPTYTPPAYTPPAATGDTKVYNDLALKGRKATFTAEYFDECQSSACKESSHDPKTYYRQYYTPGKNRIDSELTSSYAIEDLATRVYFSLPDANTECNAVSYLDGPKRTFECSPSTFDLTSFVDLLTYPTTESGMLSAFTEAKEVSPKTIAGEEARCFDISVNNSVKKTFCLTSDGIVLSEKTYTEYFESELTVTKITRTVKDTDFDSLNGKTY